MKAICPECEREVGASKNGAKIVICTHGPGKDGKQPICSGSGAVLRPIGSLAGEISKGLNTGK
jgi:hypothetical protein